MELRIAVPALNPLARWLTRTWSSARAQASILGVVSIILCGVPWNGDSHALATWTVGDLVWNDLDGDGLQDAGEPGVAGIPATLYKNATCVGTTPFRTTVTGSDGTYGFAELPAGRIYCIRFQLPPGWGVTAADQGNDDALDSDADPQSAEIINLALGADDLQEDIGLSRRIYLPLLLRTRAVINGGFENGNSDGWQLVPDAVLGTPSVVAESPFAGAYAMLLGDPSFCNAPKPGQPGDRVTAAWQDLYVPNRSGAPRLQFHYRILTYDHITWRNGTTVGDSLDVYVDSQLALRDNFENYPLAAPECASLQDSGWRTLDQPWFQEDTPAHTLGVVDHDVLHLSEWKGKQVKVRFEVRTRVDGYDNTWAYLDEVQVVFE